MLLVGLAHFSFLPFYISLHASQDAPPPQYPIPYQQLVQASNAGDGGHGLDLHREKLPPDPGSTSILTLSRSQGAPSPAVCLVLSSNRCDAHNQQCLVLCSGCIMPDQSAPAAVMLV